MFSISNPLFIYPTPWLHILPPHPDHGCSGSMPPSCLRTLVRLYITPSTFGIRLSSLTLGLCNHTYCSPESKVTVEISAICLYHVLGYCLNSFVFPAFILSARLTGLWSLGFGELQWVPFICASLESLPVKWVLHGGINEVRVHRDTWIYAHGFWYRRQGELWGKRMSVYMLLKHKNTHR